MGRDEATKFWEYFEGLPTRVQLNYMNERFGELAFDITREWDEEQLSEEYKFLKELQAQEKLHEDEDEWTIIYATKGKGFQEYKYSNGERVPDGAPIGIEKDDELQMLDGIYYSDEADNYEDDEEDVAYNK